MRTIMPLAAALLAATATPASASLLGGLAKRIAAEAGAQLRSQAESGIQSAAEGAIQKAGEMASGGGRASAGAPASPTAPASMPAAAPAAAAAPATTPTAKAAPRGPEPWPSNAGDARLQRPGQLEFSDELVRRKRALDAFGKVRCSDCEGGYAYDTSIRLLVPGWYREDHPLEKKVGEMEVGESFAWSGKASRGLLELVGAQPVGRFPCKQVRYRLVRGSETAERPGLFCYGRREYSNVDEWLEIF